jgi:hypothetical protein
VAGPTNHELTLYQARTNVWAAVNLSHDRQAATSKEQGKNGARQSMKRAFSSFLVYSIPSFIYFPKKPPFTPCSPYIRDIHEDSDLLADANSCCHSCSFNHCHLLT